MLCSKCNKNHAMVFYSTSKPDDKNPEMTGICVSCAKNMGIKPVQDMIQKMGITDDDVKSMEESLGEIMEGDNPNELEQGINESLQAIENDDENEFLPGGAATFPPVIKGIFSKLSNVFLNEKEKREDEKNENLNQQKSSDQKKKSKRKYLDLYCTNLVEKAKNGSMDRIIDRDKELERVIQILCRRTKNNPCLIGEPGVGKTAIAEGLAMKIAENTVPYNLKFKEVHLLDMTALVAGTQFRGQFESRIKGLIDEVKKEGNIILFIDEIHTLVKAGDSEGVGTAANILKPALSRGEIQVIGATTFKEYRKHIEKDSALERRFQPVKIAEPSVKDAMHILSGIKDYYENHHRVRVSEELIEKMVILSERYITDRFLPDKAIDLLDESCTHAALRNKDLNTYDKNNDDLKKLKSEEEKISLSPDINYEILADIRQKIAVLEKSTEEIGKKALSSEVTLEDIAKVIELWTGIPSTKIQESEFKKLEKLENRLKEKIIGQDTAVKELSSAIKRTRVQISPRRRPASFIFVGSTGMGKTELVKVLAQELFDTPDALIRVDMSEYMEKHAASKIIGSPPGYVGYEDAGQLTEKVRQRPYSVILFDEIEKSHPDVMNILLQILDEGKISDAQGKTINFENTVLVMTSNAGSEIKGGSLGFGKSGHDLTKEKAMKSLKEFLRPEFISRLDDIIVFNNLDVKDYEKIAKLMLNEYVELLKEHKIDLEYDNETLKLLAEKSINGKSGARDLRNLIRKEVEDKLSEMIIKKGNYNIGDVKLTAKEKKFVLENI